MESGPISVAVSVYADVEQFRSAAAPCFAADPIGTNVAASASAGAAAASAAGATAVAAAPPAPGEPAPGTLWAVVRTGDGDPLGLAFRTPPWPLHLSRMPDAAAVAVARLVHRRGDALEMVSGDATATASFVREWRLLTGAIPALTVDEGIHVLGSLVPPTGVPGIARTAGPDDAPLVGVWLAAFAAEVHLALPPRPVDVERTARRLAEGTMVLWENDGEPVSLAGWHPPSAGVGRIGPVFTPPEHRRRGFAAAVTAAATRAVLAAGAGRVMLFTDLANPTSNGVYARLGFRRVGDASEWQLSPPPPPPDPPRS